MDNLQLVFNRHRKYILYLLAVLVLGWGFTPYQTIFMGLILGTGVSFFNIWLMVRRMNKFGEAVLSGRKMRSLGTISRMAAAVLAVYIAMQYPDIFNLISVIIGLMTSYFLIVTDALISTLFGKDKQQEER
ncbi:ATP synthase subunit I [Siminovitchia sediminis]|uniref:ATP synthase subunit I n=1 Tax=Siminovitchia sediminis TaxID=1274353 RepID=A0ABW4KLX5_9BACI